MNVNDLGFYLVKLALDKVQGIIKISNKDDEMDTVVIVLPSKVKGQTPFSDQTLEIATSRNALNWLKSTNS